MALCTQSEHSVCMQCCTEAGAAFFLPSAMTVHSYHLPTSYTLLCCGCAMAESFLHTQTSPLVFFSTRHLLNKDFCAEFFNTVYKVYSNWSCNILQCEIITPPSNYPRTSPCLLCCFNYARRILNAIACKRNVSNSHFKRTLDSCITIETQKTS